MYCSACGSAVSQNLSYCNRCGAKVGGGGNKASELSLNHLVTAITFVFIVGLGAVIALMALMGNGASFNPIVLVAAALTFLMLFVVEGFLMYLLLKGRWRAGVAAAGRLTEQTTRELGESPARSLPEPTSSVTEHTTRTFDPAYSERKAK
jgi:hypothetical protein